MRDLQQLRVHAISHSLFPPTTLKAAIERMGFVQADPIRSPAAAQDLILRQRVKLYHAGDLERRYASLNIEEDFFYAYGFLPREIWQLLHPRNTRNMIALERKVLDVVRERGEIHPRELETDFGRERVTNAWGGYSKATTEALDHLHYRGLLRIVRREKGIRVYAVADESTEAILAEERWRRLILVIANILAPAPVKSLQETIARIGRSMPKVDVRSLLTGLLEIGELECDTVDGIKYIWPAGKNYKKEVPRNVLFLAPFDPLVWDRRRFEHLWGWPYRFEAYTPISKRVRGYYAMPLLWVDRVIGWANLRVNEKKLAVELGFVDKRPRDAEFRIALELEIERVKGFLFL